MLRCLSSIGSAVAISLVFTASAFPAPVTTADLSGKKICWDYGLISTFFPGGKYYANMAGNGAWRVTSVGVEIRAEHYNGIYDIDQQPDGTLKSATKYSSGRYCK
jgi:hypothetical protein